VISSQVNAFLPNVLSVLYDTSLWHKSIIVIIKVFKGAKLNKMCTSLQS
jgi:hypothetical protein